MPNAEFIEDPPDPSLPTYNITFEHAEDGLLVVTKAGDTIVQIRRLRLGSSPAPGQQIGVD